MHDDDGKKLVIGTQTMDALVTLSLRIDISAEPCVGAQAHLFDIEPSESNNIRIYLDDDCIKKASKILLNEQTYINKFNTIGQLRQLWSGFHVPSTYFCCRCSGPITNNHTLQPYTVFTVCDYDSAGDGSDTKLKSLLLRDIAFKVFTDTKPRLNKSMLSSYINKSKFEPKEVNTQIQKIIDMCGG
jgi:hypothetical protein